MPPDLGPQHLHYCGDCQHNHLCACPQPTLGRRRCAPCHTQHQAAKEAYLAQVAPGIDRVAYGLLGLALALSAPGEEPHP